MSVWACRRLNDTMIMSFWWQSESPRFRDRGPEWQCSMFALLLSFWWQSECRDSGSSSGMTVGGKTVIKILVVIDNVSLSLSKTERYDDNVILMTIRIPEIPGSWSGMTVGGKTVIKILVVIDNVSLSLSKTERYEDDNIIFLMTIRISRFRIKSGMTIYKFSTPVILMAIRISEIPDRGPEWQCYTFTLLMSFWWQSESRFRIMSGMTWGSKTVIIILVVIDNVMVSLWTSEQKWLTFGQPPSLPVGKLRLDPVWHCKCQSDPSVVNFSPFTHSPLYQLHPSTFNLFTFSPFSSFKYTVIDIIVCVQSYHLIKNMDFDNILNYMVKPQKRLLAFFGNLFGHLYLVMQ